MYEMFSLDKLDNFQMRKLLLKIWKIVSKLFNLIENICFIEDKTMNMFIWKRATDKVKGGGRIRSEIGPLWKFSWVQKL